MKIYKGIIKKNDLQNDLGVIGFFLEVEQILSLMKCLSPDFVKIENNIYILSNYLGYGTAVNAFDNTNQGKEKYVNNISISDVFYFSQYEESLYKNNQIDIGNYILNFWRERLYFLFPDKNFEYILSENNLYDENGVCITFCQKI
jgi:hypothetical protein